MTRLTVFDGVILSSSLALSAVLRSELGRFLDPELLAVLVFAESECCGLGDSTGQVMDSSLTKGEVRSSLKPAADV